MVYNVYFLTQDRSTQTWHPHLKEMQSDEPVNHKTNSDLGFRDDPVIQGFKAELEGLWQTTVVVQSVVEVS